MEDSYLEARLSLLRSSQNPDGGWGYFPGKQSWLEPTAYAAMALHGKPAADRAWALLTSWQATGGGWRPSADVHIAHWDTALCVTLATVRGEFGEPFRKGVDWLLNSAGVESSFLNLTVARIGRLDMGRDVSLRGWPWKPDTASWVEPTAHTLVALKKASSHLSSRELQERVRVGDLQLLDVRCKDGGWNYGSRSARGVDLPSYPETTALALIGLQEHAGLERSLDVAGRMARETASPLARAWLAVALRLHGADIAAFPASPPSFDLLLTAIEALGCAEGNHKFFNSGNGGAA